MLAQLDEEFPKREDGMRRSSRSCCARSNQIRTRFEISSCSYSATEAFRSMEFAVFCLPLLSRSPGGRRDSEGMNAENGMVLPEHCVLRGGLVESILVFSERASSAL